MNMSPLRNRVQQKKQVHRKKKPVVTANVAGTKYEIVHTVIEEMNFQKAKKKDKMANLIWSDAPVQSKRISGLLNYQRINHFPGMKEICRKDCLARNMAKMIKSHPQEYNFIPKTWILPAKRRQFQNYVKNLKKKHMQKTFIVKPANGAMGHGIFLIQDYKKIPVRGHFVVQEYLDNPLLLEGYKFDLRTYALVTSCDPPCYFLYKNGLVRLSTEKYHTPNKSNLDQQYMHLTNYSVNKDNENFERDETVDKGSKRSIEWFTEFLRTNGYDVDKFWGDVSELVAKTLIVAEPHVLQDYRALRPRQPPQSPSVCFEVLGFDIILDRDLKPWLLEINRAPSFGTDEKIDYDVKKGALFDALKLLNISASDKRQCLAQQDAKVKQRLYRQRTTQKPTAGPSDLEKQLKVLECRREELKKELAQHRKQEVYTKCNLGNYRWIYPPDDKLLFEKYASLRSTAFHASCVELQASSQKKKEEEIQDQLKQCENDYEKLSDQFSKQKGSEVQSPMPESSPTPRWH